MEHPTAALVALDDTWDLPSNRLLESLSSRARAELRPCLERVAMHRGQVFNRVNTPIKHLYFIERGMVSQVKIMRDGRTVEIGAVGIEGVADPSGIFHIEHAILESIVQIPGTALRIERSPLLQKMATNAEIARLMQRYAAVALNHLMQTAACNCLHAIEQRFCRWLLIAHDNALGDSFPLTHEFLAMMLGVQRASVSIAARGLQRAGLIDYGRGRVTVVDRRALENAACECYGTLREQFDSLYERVESHRRRGTL
ncbi:MAG TPA: Crp/Fnr family transcriptional regulator [Candidatus Baltobacteraceae bacterium]|nr:Crp/Fnr family transcriptional regulator [Candidatus Baltobacteraceae bacterium]